MRGLAPFWSDLFEKFGLMLLGLAVFAAVIGIILFLADRAPKRAATSGSCWPSWLRRSSSSRSA